MPANLPREWYLLEEKVREAKSLQEKVSLLEKLIGMTPKHKGTENLLAELRKRLSKYRRELERKKKVGRATSEPKFKVEKCGSVVVGVVGFTNCGKSWFINKLCGRKVLEESPREFTTTLPKSVVFLHEGIRFQLVEIPSFFTPEALGCLTVCDLVVILLDGRKGNLASQAAELRRMVERYCSNVLVVVNAFDGREIKGCENGSAVLKVSSEEFERELILERMWKLCGKIRVFTKPPGGRVSEEAIVVEKGSTVKDVLEELSERMVETFRFARVYTKGSMVKRVGLDYELEDRDILEIHAR